MEGMLGLSKEENWIKEEEDKIIENKKTKDPEAWIRKYLIILSEESLL
jgi:hypothetical protein